MALIWSKAFYQHPLNINYNPKQTIVNVDLCFIFSVFLTEGGERSRDTKLKQHFRRLLLKTKS